MTAESPRRPSETPPEARRAGIGPLVFAITLVAVLVFFWWLLIYDHGVGGAG